MLVKGVPRISSHQRAPRSCGRNIPNTRPFDSCSLSFLLFKICHYSPFRVAAWGVALSVLIRLRLWIAKVLEESVESSYPLSEFWIPSSLLKICAGDYWFLIKFLPLLCCRSVRSLFSWLQAKTPIPFPISLKLLICHSLLRWAEIQIALRIWLLFF